MAQAKRIKSRLYMHMTAPTQQSASSHTKQKHASNPPGVQVPPVILPDIISGGFCESAKPARTNPQFAIGPHVCVVLSPVGLFQSSRSLPASPLLATACLMGPLMLAQDCSKQAGKHALVHTAPGTSSSASTEARWFCQGTD